MGGYQDILPEPDCVVIAVAPGGVDSFRYDFGEIVTAVHPGLEGFFGDRLAIPFGAGLRRRKNIPQPTASDSLENR